MAAKKKPAKQSTRAPKKPPRTRRARVVVFAQVDAFGTVCDALNEIAQQTHQSDESLLRAYFFAEDGYELQITVANVERRATDDAWQLALEEFPKRDPTAVCFVGCWPQRSGLVFGPLNITTHTGKLEWALRHFEEQLDDHHVLDDVPRLLLLGPEDDGQDLVPEIGEADANAFRSLVRSWNPVDHVIAFGRTTEDAEDARVRLIALLVGLGIDVAAVHR